MRENSRATVEEFHENKQWFLSTQNYEPLNKFLTCVVGLPGTDRRLLAGTLQFMLPVQSPLLPVQSLLDLNRWKLIQLIKLQQLKETLSVLLCCEVGHAIGFLQFCIHTLWMLDICTQEANQMKSFLLECLPFKSPAVTLCITRFNIQKSYVQPTQCIYAFCMDLRTVIISLHNIISKHRIHWMVFITDTECLLLYIFHATTLYSQYLHQLVQCLYLLIIAPACFSLSWWPSSSRSLVFLTCASYAPTWATEILNVWLKLYLRLKN